MRSEVWGMKRNRPLEERIGSLRNQVLLERPFIGFISRFMLTYIALTAAYQLYLMYTNYTHTLDWVTYSVSEFSYYLAQALGVTDCTFSCFIEGCYVGREGKLIHVIEGCNGFRLAIAYGSFIVGYSKWNAKVFVQVIAGLLIIQAFNVLRIGVLIALRDLGGDVYFYFVKYLFGSVIYAAILTLWSLQPRFDRWVHASDYE